MLQTYYTPDDLPLILRIEDLMNVLVISLDKRSAAVPSSICSATSGHGDDCLPEGRRPFVDGQYPESHKEAQRAPLSALKALTECSLRYNRNLILRPGADRYYNRNTIQFHFGKEHDHV